MVIGPITLGLLLLQPGAMAGTQLPGPAVTGPAVTGPASTGPASTGPASTAPGATAPGATAPGVTSVEAGDASLKGKLLEGRFDEIVNYEMGKLVKSYGETCGKKSAEVESNARPQVKSPGYYNHTTANQGLFTDSGSLAITDRLAAAVNMSAPDGFAAGFAIAPFSLFQPGRQAKSGWRSAHRVLEGLKASVATGKEQQVRLGFGWALTVMKEIPYRDMISRQQVCDKYFYEGEPKPNPPIKSPLERRERKTLAAAKEVFVDACLNHVPTFANAPENVQKQNAGLIEAARNACGSAVEIRGGWLHQVAEAVTAVYKEWPTASSAVSWSPESAKKLQWRAPDPYSETTEAAIVAEFQRHLWETPQLRFSVEGNFDFAPIRWGFAPTTAEDGMAVQKPLSRGELEASQIKGAVYIRYKRVEGLLGFGGGRMLDLEMKARTFLLPSAQFGVVVASLDPRIPLLDDKGRLRTTESGDLPPRLVLGVEGSLRPMLGASAADAETSVYPQAHIEAVRLGLFADFRVQKNLSFRLGIPVEGKMVLQKKDDATGIGQDVGMQWSIPVFLTTIVAM